MNRAKRQSGDRNLETKFKHEEEKERTEKNWVAERGDVRGTSPWADVFGDKGKRDIINQFVNDGDWVERFIQAVQSRLPIYNTKLPEHLDRNLILRLWSEIFKTMIPTWQEMTSSEKSLKHYNETEQNND
ncbi:Hypothetical protein CINCED_3A025032 [Cinara cedri]|uniref:Uncharacterized protein n=1 Tax=Cinara cedri TaxID=506608 RepID=A0A5E4MZW8_9HEMI|nr:Hypothetical protein CINCED_3A025032 [Cinara cedri]